MHGGDGPDLLGVCEIETKEVAEKLLEELDRDDLVLAHIASTDIRGIDKSLFYSRDVFDLVGDPVGHLVHFRYPTRDIFEVRLKVKSNQAEILVLVNHWPSRWRGIYVTEPYRITVANQRGRIIDRYLKYPRAEYLSFPSR